MDKECNRFEKNLIKKNGVKGGRETGRDRERMIRAVREQQTGPPWPYISLFCIAGVKEQGKQKEGTASLKSVLGRRAYEKKRFGEIESWFDQGAVRHNF